MILTQAIRDPEQIYQLILQFDDVMPHLKEKVADYRAFSEKLAQYARVLVAGDGGEIRGFVVFYANDKTTFTGFVTLLACAREYQGRGLGKFLMEQACTESAAAGMKNMRLEVDLDNTGAIAFYNKLGFMQLGEKMSGSMYMEKKLVQTEYSR